MTRNAYYPDADRTTQNFSRTYRGAPIQPNVNVLHTTEGTSWPSYSGGGSAPHFTGKPIISRQRMEIRQHFPLTMSSRALRNDSGGVETNTLNCMQFELIGTCDPAHRERWSSRRAGKDYIFWPDAPDWALREVAKVLAFMTAEWAVKPHVPKRWPAYPTSYANGGGQRLTGYQWRRFYGTVGHMHVTENTHGDPGNIDIKKIIRFTKELVPGPDPKPRPKPKPRSPNADEVLELAGRALSARQSKARKQKWAEIKRLASELSAQD